MSEDTEAKLYESGLRVGVAVEVLLTELPHITLEEGAPDYAVIYFKEVVTLFRACEAFAKAGEVVEEAMQKALRDEHGLL